MRRWRSGGRLWLAVVCAGGGEGVAYLLLVLTLVLLEACDLACHVV